MKPKYIIGIDVGGTNIKLGIVDVQGKIVDRNGLDTKQFGASKKDLIGGIITRIDDLLQRQAVSRRDLEGVGFGLPGLIDPVHGVVKLLPNIPGWRNVPLKEMMEDRLGVPAFLENDVNLIALGEWKFGAGQGCSNMIVMTLGTGVGAGLILDGRLYRGENFVAGELGHMPLNEEGPECPCGGHGCFERYVGNAALGRQLDVIFKKKGMEPRDAYALSRKGNKTALAFWDSIGERLGNGLVGAVNLLNPRLIVIGGGVANNFPYFKPAMQRIIRDRAMSVQGRAVKIVRSRLKNDAGIIGASVLVHEASS